MPDSSMMMPEMMMTVGWLPPGNSIPIERNQNMKIAITVMNEDAAICVKNSETPQRPMRRVMPWEKTADAAAIKIKTKLTLYIAATPPAKTAVPSVRTQRPTRRLMPWEKTADAAAINTQPRLTLYTAATPPAKKAVPSVRTQRR